MFVKRVYDRFVRNDSGTTAVEFAILAPIFFTLLFGIFMLGWRMNSMASVNYALEESSRALQMNNLLSQSQLDAMVKSRVQDLKLTNINLVLTIDPPSGGIKIARLTAKYNYDLTMPFIATSVVVYERTITIPLRA